MNPQFASRRPQGPSPRRLALRGLIAAMAVLGHLSSANAQGDRQQERQSDYTLAISPAFHFSQGRVTTLPSEDCMFLPDADAALANRQVGREPIRRITGTLASYRFLQSAYRGRLAERNYANVDEIAVARTGEDQYRVYLGSRRIGLFCGFTAPQFLDREWAEAGFENKTLYRALPPRSPIEELSLLYTGQSYTAVRDSMVLRGFKPIKLAEPVIERCSPGIEAICQRYEEALCARNLLGQTGCAFRWSDAKGDGVIVNAAIGTITRFYIEAQVTQLAPAED